MNQIQSFRRFIADGTAEFMLLDDAVVDLKTRVSDGQSLTVGRGFYRVQLNQNMVSTILAANADLDMKLRTYFRIRDYLETHFDKVTYTHVPRENENIQMADALVNEALDKALRIR